MDNLSFTIPEILSLLGAAQCIYLLVYMLLRSGSIKSVFLPSFYFLVLAAAFAFDFGRASVSSLIPHFEIWNWALWFMGPPLSVLLILQILQLPHMPPLKHFWVLLLVPLAFALSHGFTVWDESCTAPHNCATFDAWLVVTGLLAGLTSMVAIWFQRDKLASLKQEKAGRDRYWLIITLVFMNLCFLGLMLASLTSLLDAAPIVLMRTLLGLGFVYVAGTSLFRIYPQAVLLIQRGAKGELSAPDEVLLGRIHDLMDVQKLYQEPTCSRATLARELSVSEGTLSRVINARFGKSVPQLINERRIEDAKRLLAETNAAVKVVAEEVGFSALASFNRVFKDTTGESPSSYRATMRGRADMSVTDDTFNNTKNH